jgi:hypothetical protein
VLGTYRRRQAQRTRVQGLAREESFSGDVGATELAHDLDRVRAAFSALSPEGRRALRSYFGAENPSVRAVARDLGTSRWMAARLVSDALEDTATSLGIGGTASARIVPTTDDRTSVSTRSRARTGRHRGRKETRIMSHDIHEALRARLQDEAAGTLPSEEATRLLEHAAECEECARLLAEHPAHAEALLDAAHADAAVDPEVEDLIAASQTEVLVVGRAALERLPAKAHARLDVAISQGRREDLWTLRDLKPRELRAALSVSEASLAMQSALLASDWEGMAVGRFQKDAFAIGDDKAIPASYFSQRIAKHAETDDKTAGALWSAIVAVVEDGKVGLPGLEVVPDEAACSLRLARDEPQMSRAPQAAPIVPHDLNPNQLRQLGIAALKVVKE